MGLGSSVGRRRRMVSSGKKGSGLGGELGEVVIVTFLYVSWT